MKHIKYSAYKPSESPWLGEIPAHWREQPLFAVLFETSARNRGEVERNLLSLSYGRVVRKDIDSTEGLLPETFTTYQIVEKDDIVLRLTDLQNDQRSLRVGHVPARGIITSAYLNLRSRSGTLSRFLFYQLYSFDIQKLFYKFGGGVRQSMNFADLKWIRLALPPYPEQQLICSFLDRRTSEIDGLLAQKRTLIRKLQEKRTALISHTVTVGLPQEAARAAGVLPPTGFKPSRVQWLGEIPVHWKVTPLKFIARIGNGSTPNRENAEYWEDGTYPWLNSAVVNQEQVTSAEEYVTVTALRECHLPRIQPPAVLVGITGQGRTRGLATTLQIEATINQHVAFIKPRPDIADVSYARRVFDKAYEYLRSESDGAGSTKGALTCEQLAATHFPLPPLPEQRAISDYLDRETDKIHSLIAKVEQAIEALQEYRSALISGAVTGKIDVRNAAQVTEMHDTAVSGGTG